MKICSVLLTGLVLAAFATRGDARGTPRPSLDLRLLDTPQAVRTDAGTQVFEELHLANVTQAPLRLLRVDVVEAGTGRVLATFAGEALRGRMAGIGAAAPRPNTTLAPGGRAVIYIEWRVQGRPPRAIGHRVAYDGPAVPPGIVRGGEASVSRDAGEPLGPPVRGGPWVAIHRADWPRGHRRVFNTVDGTARIPGRFAIDWIRVDAAGHVARGDADVPRHWLGYGAEVLAVADATVVAVRDTMSEPDRVSARRKLALSEDAGNYVAIRLGDDRYAFYEHLKPGSIKVAAGQRVRRGDVLGELGFTGESTGPHLHFHVADGPSTISAEGRPFEFDRFDLLGSYGDLGKLGKAGWSPRRKQEAERRHDEWPAQNAVLRFAD